MADMDDAGANLARLSDILNKLSDKKNMLGVETRNEVRSGLLTLEGKFNDVAHPAIEKLAAALPDLYDYSSKWIAARMLRDLALFEPVQKSLLEEDPVGHAFTALAKSLMTEKDAGTKYTLAGHVGEIAIAHKQYAVQAAATMTLAFASEKDAYSNAHISATMLKLGTEHEAAGAVVIDGFTQQLAKETDPARITQLSRNILMLGQQHNSLLQTAGNALLKKIMHVGDNAISTRVLVNDAVALTEGRYKIPQTIKTLARAFRAAEKHELLSSYVHGLAQIGEAHPTAVLSAIEQELKRKPDAKHSRLLTQTLVQVVRKAGDSEKLCADMATSIMADHLPNEATTANRREIAKSMLDLARSGAASEPLVRTLNTALETEKEVETRKEYLDILRKLGHVRPFISSSPTPKVVPFKPHQKYT